MTCYILLLFLEINTTKRSDRTEIIDRIDRTDRINRTQGKSMLDVKIRHEDSLQSADALISVL